MSKELFWQSDSSIALQRWNADMGEAMYDDVGNVEYDIMQYTRYSYIEWNNLSAKILADCQFYGCLKNLRLQKLGLT